MVEEAILVATTMQDRALSFNGRKAYGIFRSKRESKKAWDSLREMRARRSKYSQYALRVKFFRLQMTADRSIRSLIQEIAEVENNLAHCGPTLKERINYSLSFKV